MKQILIVTILLCAGTAHAQKYPGQKVADALTKPEKTLANRVARTLAIQADAISEAWAYGLDTDVTLQLFNTVVTTLQKQASRSREFAIYSTSRAAAIVLKLCENRSNEFWNACYKGAAVLQHMARRADDWHKFLETGVEVHKTWDPVYKAVMRTLSF